MENNIPWCVFGDFNDMLHTADKMGSLPHPKSLLDGFKAVLEECGLLELDLLEGEFTWEQSQGTPNWVRERLDRAFADEQWWRKFPLCKLSVSHTISSDHDPILLEPIHTSFSRKQLRFKFENAWLSEPNSEEVAQYWHNIPRVNLLPKLMSVSTFMARWGRNFFHKFWTKIKKQKEIISALNDRSDEDEFNSISRRKENSMISFYRRNCTGNREPIHFWLTEGDRNSKYFHAVATKRKKSNHIPHLINSEEEIITDHATMSSMVVKYFKSIFQGDIHPSQQVENDGKEHVITATQNSKLTTDINFAELTLAVKQMHPDKSAGPDGFSPAFFQHFWGLVGEDIFKCCQTWLSEGELLVNLNDTTLVLIPKKENAEILTDRKPIASCNVL